MLQHTNTLVSQKRKSSFFGQLASVSSRKNPNWMPKYINSTSKRVWKSLHKKHITIGKLFGGVYSYRLKVKISLVNIFFHTFSQKPLGPSSLVLDKSSIKLTRIHAAAIILTRFVSRHSRIPVLIRHSTALRPLKFTIIYNVCEIRKTVFITTSYDFHHKRKYAFGTINLIKIRKSSKLFVTILQ